MEFKIAFIGFGVVGQGLAEIFVEQEAFLKEKYNFNFKVVAISDTMKGSVYDKNGLDIQNLLELVKSTGKIDSYQNGIKGWDSLKTITDTNANLILEVAWTDLKTGEPAMTHVKTALKNKKHVVMTNKGPIALAVRELLQIAKENNVEMRYEGTVLSGTPALNLGLYNLAGSGITEARGIVNGTTNYILTEMERGLSYEDALKQAQELGYAEADPTADVEGYDALGKIVILANTVMGASLHKDEPPCEGITKITSEDIAKAKEEGFRWKLIAGAVIKDDGSVEAYVKPEKIPLEHPLANIMGPTNALTYTTKYLGDVTIVGPGAGRAPTGFALLTDILDINRLLSKS
ncbi:MAG: homoserine dehydrogenase [Candidatus Heimdallarchaeota archaeon]|nr:homoserine dehydrogenase [Candidatus Heimdallarchaeota archaeon]MCK4770428.1 homoserine dehydrogenase [Candidatus Heimdallarchaeota archaeon]